MWQAVSVIVALPLASMVLLLAAPIWRPDVTVEYRSCCRSSVGGTHQVLHFIAHILFYLTVIPLGVGGFILFFKSQAAYEKWRAADAEADEKRHMRLHARFWTAALFVYIIGGCFLLVWAKVVLHID